MTEQKPTTTDAGIPVESDEHSLSVGPDGPILLQDHYLIEQMAQFNRERIPERQPHAKGGGAFGRFEVTHDVSAYTKAAVFQPGTTTDMLARFSTVAGERGSPDTWRDPRGFSLKLYTSEGNYDMVGNNTPVFFIKDPMKFQHFIRSQKRRADNNLRDHDMQWDFWTLSPESAHQVTWLMGDRGIPRTWRHMNGYSSHTYMWVNAAGEKFWVKYHFKTDQGIEFLTQDEADQMAPADTDYHQRDLFEHIEDGDLPSWTLQDADHAVRGRQDLPVQPVRPHQGVAARRLPAHRGRPADAQPQRHRLPHRDRAGRVRAQQPRARHRPAPDQMLLARGFAYADAHRARLGVNYQQIPVNRAAVPVHSYSKDGTCGCTTSPTRSTPRTRTAAPRRTRALRRAGGLGGRRRDGARGVHAAAEDDDWGQAGTLVREVLDDAARERLVDNIVGHLLRRRQRRRARPRLPVLAQRRQDLGDRVADGVGQS